MSISLFIFVYIFFFPAVAISGEDSQLNDLLNKAEEKKLNIAKMVKQALDNIEII